MEESDMYTKPDIKIGDRFFIFNENRRVYKRDDTGKAIGGPTFRGHFEPVTIDGETSRSWVIQKGWKKVPKSDPFSVLHTEEMIDEREFVAVHSYHIGEVVRRTKDADTLRKIAEIIGYEVEP